MMFLLEFLRKEIGILLLISENTSQKKFDEKVRKKIKELTNWK